MLRRLSIKALIVIVPVIVLLLSASSAVALGIGVAPGKMDFSVRPGGYPCSPSGVIGTVSVQQLDFIQSADTIVCTCSDRKRGCCPPIW